MKIEAKSVGEYIGNVPESNRNVLEKLRQVILANLPEGFVEQMSYDMIGYVVPLELYPAGYRAKKNEPLPFMALAAQKNHLALYHMGLYGNKELDAWFQEQYAIQAKTKLDMGKSCIRFKNPDDIPYALIGQLVQKISVDDYIAMYEKSKENQDGK